MAALYEGGACIDIEGAAGVEERRGGRGVEWEWKGRTVESQ